MVSYAVSCNAYLKRKRTETLKNHYFSYISPTLEHHFGTKLWNSQKNQKSTPCTHLGWMRSYKTDLEDKRASIMQRCKTSHFRQKRLNYIFLEMCITFLGNSQTNNLSQMIFALSTTKEHKISEHIQKQLFRVYLKLLENLKSEWF